MDPRGKNILRVPESGDLGFPYALVLGIYPCKSLFPVNFQSRESICRSFIECFEPLYAVLMILDILIEDLNILRRLGDLSMALGQAELHLIDLEFQKDKYE